MIDMQAVMNCIFAHRGKECVRLPLALNAQHHHDIGIGDRILDSLLDANTLFDQFGKLLWHQSPGSSYTHRRAQFRKQVHVRARHARMQNVPDDRDFQTFDAAFVLANGERVEERLRRMFVRAVARIHNRGVAHTS